VLNQSSHTANLNAQLSPWKHFVVAAGVQTEWAHQEGFGDALLDNGDDADPTTGVPAVVSANHDRFSAEQNVVARFTGIQRTVLFAETRLRQETIGQFEQEQGGVGDEFLRATDALNRWQEYRAGFQTSPWRPVSLSSHYKRRYRDSEYDHDRDVNPATPVGNGYSAFILSRDTSLDEIEARVTWHALAWLKSSLTYRVTATDYRTETASAVVFPARLAPPGGRLLSGNHDAHHLALNATLTPVARLYLSATLSWQNSRIVTQETNNPAVAPYKGDVYSILTTATYALSPKTDLLASYVFSHADYGQDNDAFGLPLGTVYHSHGLQAGLSRQVTKQVKLNLQYGWYRYDESSSGGWADYAAHGLFAVVNVRWP
ncbi:MAG TPA: hypothetical protein VNO52_10825, partial [Methylomirabilota bacterium]|nr:hypothetical protein [Methylomirabilota bacterium]